MYNLKKLGFMTSLNDSINAYIFNFIPSEDNIEGFIKNLRRLYNSSGKIRDCFGGENYDVWFSPDFTKYLDVSLFDFDFSIQDSNFPFKFKHLFAIQFTINRYMKNITVHIVDSSYRYFDIEKDTLVCYDDFSFDDLSLESKEIPHYTAVQWYNGNGINSQLAKNHSCHQKDHY